MEPEGNILTPPVGIWSQLNPITRFFLPSKYMLFWLDAILTSWMRSRWKVFKVYRLYFRLIKSAIYLHSKSRRLLIIRSNMGKSMPVPDVYTAMQHLCMGLFIDFYKVLSKKWKRKLISFHSPETWSHIVGGLNSVLITLLMFFYARLIYR